MEVGDIVVYDGREYNLACGNQYFYVCEFLASGEVWLLQLSKVCAGWGLHLPKSDLTVVGKAARLLTPDEQYVISRTRAVPTHLHELLQPWLGERVR